MRKVRSDFSIAADLDVLSVFLTTAVWSGGEPLTTSELAEAARVSLTHIHNLGKKGYLKKVNPKRHPTEEFRWVLGEAFNI